MIVTVTHSSVIQGPINISKLVFAKIGLKLVSCENNVLSMTYGDKIFIWYGKQLILQVVNPISNSFQTISDSEIVFSDIIPDRYFSDDIPTHHYQMSV